MNIKSKKSAIFLILLFFVSVSFSACSDSDDKPEGVVTDYSNPNNWVVNPGVNVTKDVDVFYLYPTLYMGENEYASVANPDSELKEAISRNRNYYASVYEKGANLYMPYYRQMSLNSMLYYTPEQKERRMHAITIVDAWNAFMYYIKHYNNGRPFILAGHSQGSNVMLYIVERLKTRPDLMERFVAGYLIGYSVTKDYLAKNQHVSFAQGRTDQKVLISWMTESPGVTAPCPVVLPGAVSINPISWTTEETHASAEESLGSRIDIDGVFVDKPHFADAQVNKERGVVVCSTVDPDDFIFPIPEFPRGALHGCDYSFYYYDLQQNIIDRAAAYFESKK